MSEALRGWPASWAGRSAIPCSPRLHGHWLQRYGVAGHYVPLASPADFESGFAALPRLGFRGVNVTIPFKETVLGLATSISDRAALIGAANTITFLPDGGAHADNTDGHGFLQNLRQAAPGWSAAAGPALVLGAGGAARAVIAALLSDGAPEIRLANRTRAARRGAARAFRRQGRGRGLAARRRGGRRRGGDRQRHLAWAWTGQPDAAASPRRGAADGARHRHRLRPLDTPLLAPGRGARPRDGGWARHAAAPGRARLRALVRRSARGDADDSAPPCSAHERADAPARAHRLDRHGQVDDAAAVRRAGVPVWDADAAVHRLYAAGGAGAAAVARALPRRGRGRGGRPRPAARGGRRRPGAAGADRGDGPPAGGRGPRGLPRHDAGAPLVVLDIPLLFETGAEAELDGVVVVTAPPEVQRARVLARPA